MDRQRAVVTLIGVAVIGGASLLGYLLAVRVENRTPPAAEISPSPSPEVVAQAPVEPAPAETGAPTVQESATAAPAVVPAPVAPSLTIESVPAVVRAGTPVVVRWSLRGPAGAIVTTMDVRAVLTGAREISMPVGGSLAVPARFEATVTPATRGTLRILVGATVAGERLLAEQRVLVE